MTTTSVASERNPSINNIPPKKLENSSGVSKIESQTSSAINQIQKTSIDAPAIAEGIQKQYNSTQTASFDFEQTYNHPLFNVAETSKGQVFYNKTKGNFLWSYLQPSNRQKKFFINGKKMTYYSVSDKTAFIHNCYEKDTLSASVTFLLGTGILKDSFNIVKATEQGLNASLSWLDLVPKESNAPIKKVLLGVDKDFKVVESIVFDPSGGRNHFKFINFRVNPKIDDSIFEFVAPPGVLVQPMPNVSCANEITQEPAKKT